MKKTRISIIRKIFLVLIGIFISLAIVEAGLRISGGIITFYDSIKTALNAAKVSDKNSRRIVCIGPCYTLGVGVVPGESFSSQLEKILKQNYPANSFEVIGTGVRGNNLSIFVNKLEYFIRKYRPQIVVLNVNSRITLYDENIIIAIGDLLSFPDSIKLRIYSFISRLKTFRLLTLAFSPVSDVLSRPILDARKDKFSLRLLDKKELFSLNLEKLKAMIKKYPNKPEYLYALSRAYAELGLYDYAVEYIKKAIEFNPNQGRYYLDLYWYYTFLGNYETAIQTQEKAFKVEPQIKNKIICKISNLESRTKSEPYNYRLYHSLSKQYALLMQYDKAIELIKKALSLSPTGLKDYDRLDFYDAAIKIMKKQPYSRKSLDRSLYFSKNFTWSFNNQIQDFLNHKKIKFNQNTLTGENVFYRLLRYNLTKALRITQKYNVKLLLENTGSSSEQQPIIVKECKELGVPLVNMFLAFKEAKDSETFFHETLSYRFNAKGHKFIAEQIYKALIDNNLL